MVVVVVVVEVVVVTDCYVRRSVYLLLLSDSRVHRYPTPTDLVGVKYRFLVSESLPFVEQVLVVSILVNSVLRLGPDRGRERHLECHSPSILCLFSVQ